ncbi:MAG: ATP-binding protein [Myxococcota bacterium]|nr:ATP-binding protein [Myxococcota bacterium]
MSFVPGKRHVILAYVLALVVLPVIVVALSTIGIFRPILVGPFIIVSAYLGGLRAGLTATVIACGFAYYFLIALPAAPGESPVGGILAAATGLIAGTIISVLFHRLRTATLNANRERDRASEALRQSARDESERCRAEAAARATHERFAHFAEATQEVFWMTSIDKREVLYVSPAYATIWGRSCASLLASANEWIDAVHPLDRDRMVEAWAAASGGSYDQEFRIVRPDGSTRWIRDRAFTVCNAEGEQIALGGISEDITSRRDLEEQLRQTQKIESLGLLAGGVAHDFNNILTAITANANMIAEGMPEAHADRELVEEIEAAVVRAAALTRQLLAFSRKQVTDPVILDVNRAVADAHKMLRRLVSDDIEIHTSLEPDLGRIRFDPSSLVQVLMNLVVNARDAMPDGGSLTIATRRSGREIALAVSDTGSGMTADVLKHAFEPFFTTKSVGKGTGLGLSVVHGIVQQAGGRIEITSELGVGTTFRVTLPAIETAADPLLGRVTSTSRGCETIVLAEDDSYVRAAAARALRARGYTVLEASEGREALRLLRDHRSDVRILVTDIVMPGMNGRELAELALERMPSLRVLFMSGYTNDTSLRQSVAHAEVHFIEKPFRIEAFAAKVRQVLDEPDAGAEADLEWRSSSSQLTGPVAKSFEDGDAPAPAPQGPAGKVTLLSLVC